MLEGLDDKAWRLGVWLERVPMCAHVCMCVVRACLCAHLCKLGMCSQTCQCVGSVCVHTFVHVCVHACS